MNTIMRDCNGKIIHEGELITIVDRPDLVGSAEYWTIFDYIEAGSFINFVLKNAITNEIKVVSQSNIQRTY
jgi:hypothetical protein